MDDTGWHWFDGTNPSDETDKDVLRETAEACARVFRSPDGQAVLQHLTALTLGRHLGPNASDATLRHLEGQRQLVGHLIAMIERGGGRTTPEPALHPTPKPRKRKTLWTRIF
ncbi:MAG: hypothetical protein J4G10_05360 [Alphaproteobacteria bacterium]|nr:hypothetical protein [Alphaproteobacteria bacterium]